VRCHWAAGTNIDGHVSGIFFSVSLSLFLSSGSLLILPEGVVVGLLTHKCIRIPIHKIKSGAKSKSFEISGITSEGLVGIGESADMCARKLLLMLMGCADGERGPSSA
jgi:hypothetical protein